MKILICGDSYSVTDPLFPGMHWSERILNYSEEYSVINLATGGCSNALILLQLLQGLKFSPDFVILSFTAEGRYEFDHDATVLPINLGVSEVTDYLKTRYTTNRIENSNRNQDLERWLKFSASENFEKLKNYFYVINCLTILTKYQIPFCYSLGGLEYHQDYTNFINSNYIYNVIDDYRYERLNTNLWYHGQEARPWFHVKDERALELFSNECVERIEGIKKC